MKFSQALLPGILAKWFGSRGSAHGALEIGAAANASSFPALVKEFNGLWMIIILYILDIWYLLYNVHDIYCIYLLYIYMHNGCRLCYKSQLWHTRFYSVVIVPRLCYDSHEGCPSQGLCIGRVYASIEDRPKFATQRLWIFTDRKMVIYPTILVEWIKRLMI